MEYDIASPWNGEKVSHSPMKLSIHPSSLSDSSFVRVNVSGKFFNDSPAPECPPGPTDFLWDYEVVEAFFLNSQDDTYLEVEFSPLYKNGGRGLFVWKLASSHICFNGRGTTLLPLKYSTTLCADTGSWQGQADIPLNYFPPKVDKFNAFAIHGSGSNRLYEQLYHQMELSAQPDM
ncbi:UPF0462 protein C4orf33 homolog [Watersipora subatra]|uniref:UPF0462 protein C4orf33 homolog n=1 Tax=Watersipora subatra TaxID=2589382 RepID=UPI00355BE3A9